jgi:hypothetical protein
MTGSPRRSSQKWRSPQHFLPGLAGDGDGSHGTRDLDSLPVAHSFERPNASERLSSAGPQKPAGRGSPLRVAALSRCLAVALMLILLCGLPHAFAQSAREVESDMTIARVHEAEKLLRNDGRNDKLSPEQLRKMADFVAGNVSFAMLHETGHGLIADMGLPVLGSEEDAADTYATVAMLTTGTSAYLGALYGAAKGWFYSDQNDRMHGEPVAFYDAHGLDVQRAYRIVCLMVGSDPAKFKDLADETKLPEDRRDGCAADLAEAKASWVKALDPHYRHSPDLPRTKISVVYGEAKGYLVIYRRFVEAVGMSEIAAGHLSDAFLWRSPFAIDWETCGEAGAHWQFKSRKLLMCYELADDFARLFRDYGDVSIPKPKIPFSSLR